MLRERDRVKEKRRIWGDVGDVGDVGDAGELAVVFCCCSAAIST